MAGAASVVTQVESRRLSLTNLDKPLFGDGTTKAELISYYLRVAPVLLPHLADRCVTRLRFPNGTDQASFFEKNAPAGTPDWVRTQRVEGSEGEVRYVVVNEAATLVWLANLAAIELHTPQWRISDRPDDPGTTTAIRLDGPQAPLATTFIVDLDPGEGVRFDQTCRAAVLAAGELLKAGLTPVVKTTGSKGLQISAPIVATPWTNCVQQAKTLAQRLAVAHPDVFVATVTKTARAGKVFVDALENSAARTAISVWSVRGRDRPYVAVPVSWDEVASVEVGQRLQFTLEQALTRIEERGDEFASVVARDGAAPLPQWQDAVST